jgi:hypothetical protein
MNEKIVEDDVQVIDSYVSRVADADSISDVRDALETNQDDFEESLASLKQWLQVLQQNRGDVDTVSDGSVEDEFSDELRSDMQRHTDQSPDEVRLMAKQCENDVDRIIDWLDTLDSLQKTTSNDEVLGMTAEIQSALTSFEDDFSLLLGQIT